MEAMEDDGRREWQDIVGAKKEKKIRNNVKKIAVKDAGEDVKRKMKYSLMNDHYVSDIQVDNKGFIFKT